MLFLISFCLFVLVKFSSPANLCTDTYKQIVARVVFGEARGETANGQLAVAYTIVNRINSHNGLYPSSFNGVVYAKYTAGGQTHHEYNTLDESSHTIAWNKAKSHFTAEYNNAVTASSGALCGTKTDPSNGATAYCAYDPCSATSDNRYSIATNKIKIGHHWFVKRVPVH